MRCVRACVAAVLIGIIAAASPARAVEAISVRSDTPAIDLTDAGVARLAEIRSLRQLDLYHTLVTDKGFEQLKSALPLCQIHYERDSAKRERRS